MQGNVNVFRTEKMVILEIGQPYSDDSLFQGQPFRDVKFLRESGEIFENSIYDGRVYGELVASGDLKQGAIAELCFQVSPVHGWIKTINGKEWH